MPAAFCCNKDDLAAREMQTGISYVDFDMCARLFSDAVFDSFVRTSFILQDGLAENDGKKLIVVTSADCSVVEKDIASFSLVSDFYFSRIKNTGICACTFSGNKRGFLIDLGVLLHTYADKSRLHAGRC
ncbi:hypothetical protein [Treponema brennaborense]|uniref:Uncharacterized protein n=1 Tax=Treponema brennaborense (strain DSM 12168 / CIP 105900 / DD5/3) TaxID=906968 RepID=F4LNT3_TREBD|nr:hypothetical protein [Treponema brennaborense]AEE16918.1 hypothetical protein Trebr_1494 [Treponema brennaborense DSM 12168]